MTHLGQWRLGSVSEQMTNAVACPGHIASDYMIICICQYSLFIHVLLQYPQNKACLGYASEVE